MQKMLYVFFLVSVLFHYYMKVKAKFAQKLLITDACCKYFHLKECMYG